MFNGSRTAGYVTDSIQYVDQISFGHVFMENHFTGHDRIKNCTNSDLSG
jgi:hypothetical protein